MWTEAYSSVAAKLLWRVTSYASSEALLYRSCELRRRTHPRHPDANDWRLPLFLAASMIGRVTSFFIVFSSFFGGSAVVLVDPDRQEIVFVLWAFAHVYIFLRKRSPTSVRPASAARDRQSQSNLFRPDLFCLSVSILSLKGTNVRALRISDCGFPGQIC